MDEKKEKTKNQKLSCNAKRRDRAIRGKNEHTGTMAVKEDEQ